MRFKKIILGIYVFVCPWSWKRKIAKFYHQRRVKKATANHQQYFHEKEAASNCYKFKIASRGTGSEF